jgi:hypothetical protein
VIVAEKPLRGTHYARAVRIHNLAHSLGHVVHLPLHEAQSGPLQHRHPLASQVPQRDLLRRGGPDRA